MEELLGHEQLSSMKTLGQRMPGRVRMLLFPRHTGLWLVSTSPDPVHPYKPALEI